MIAAQTKEESEANRDIDLFASPAPEVGHIRSMTDCVICAIQHYGSAKCYLLMLMLMLMPLPLDEAAISHELNSLVAAI
jgi:hypothetical protein